MSLRGKKYTQDLIYLKSLEDVYLFAQNYTKYKNPKILLEPSLIADLSGPYVEFEQRNTKTINFDTIQEIISLKKEYINKIYIPTISTYDFKKNKVKSLSILYWANQQGIKPLVEFLLANGADTEINNGKKEVTALLRACCQNRLEIIKLLVKAGANINASYPNGRTGLSHRLFCQGSVDTIEFLLKNGADPNLYSSNKYIPLISAFCWNKEKVRLLLEYGAEVNIVNARGRTPLSLARQYGWNDITKLIEKRLRIEKQLIIATD